MQPIKNTGVVSLKQPPQDILVQVYENTKFPDRVVVLWNWKYYGIHSWILVLVCPLVLKDNAHSGVLLEDKYNTWPESLTFNQVRKQIPIKYNSTSFFWWFKARNFQQSQYALEIFKNWKQINCRKNWNKVGAFSLK